MDTDQALKPSIATKLAYGLGYPVENIVLRTFELFILFYYTQVLGLSGLLTGAAMFLAMLVDAIFDPLIGIWSDNLRNARFGRRHTFMFIAAVPLGLAYYLVFVPPAGLGQLALFAWLAVTAIITRMACGLFLVPYSAQFNEMSRDAEVRGSLTIYKSLILTIIDLTVITATFSYFFSPTPAHPGGQSEASSYAAFALCFGIALFMVTMLSGLGTYRYMQRIEKGQVLPPAVRMSILQIAGKWKQVLGGNPNVRFLLTGILISVITSGTVRALTSHMGIFFWKLTPAQIGYWQQAAIPGMLIGLFCCRFMLRRFELIHMMIVGLAVQMAMLAIMPAFRLVGLLPPSVDPLIPYLLMGSNFISGLGGGFVLVLSGLVCAEAADEEEYHRGVPEQGLILGFIFLSIKTGSAVSKLLSGAALDLIHFPVGAKVITPEMATRLGELTITFIVVFGSLGMFFYSRFKLPRVEHARMIAAIRKRSDEAREEYAREMPPIAEEDVLIAGPTLKTA